MAASVLLGIIFAAAGLGKLLRQPDPIELFIFSEYLSLAMIRNIYVWLPRVELLIGVLLITGIAARVVATLSLPLTAGFIINNAWLLIHGFGDKACGCFGKEGGLAQTKLTIMGAMYLDAVMLVLGITILLCYQSNFGDTRPWFLRRGSK